MPHIGGFMSQMERELSVACIINDLPTNRAARASTVPPAPHRPPAAGHAGSSRTSGRDGCLPLHPLPSTAPLPSTSSPLYLLSPLPPLPSTSSPLYLLSPLPPLPSTSSPLYLLSPLPLPSQRTGFAHVANMDGDGIGIEKFRCHCNFIIGFVFLEDGMQVAASAKLSFLFS